MASRPIVSALPSVTDLVAPRRECGVPGASDFATWLLPEPSPSIVAWPVVEDVVPPAAALAEHGGSWPEPTPAAEVQQVGWDLTPVEDASPASQPFTPEPIATACELQQLPTSPPLREACAEGVGDAAAASVRDELGRTAPQRPVAGFDDQDRNELLDIVVSPETHESLSSPPCIVAAAISGHEAMAIEYPWHLTANAGLSYRAHAANSTDAEVVLVSADSALVEAHRRIVVEPTTFAQRGHARTTPPMKTEQFGGCDPAVPAADQTKVTGATQDRVMPLATTWQPMPHWPQRLLRWSEDAEGGTAWIRDFNLLAEEHASVVALVRELAHTQGRAVRRVMLNGHVLWQSPSSR